MKRPPAYASKLTAPQVAARLIRNLEVMYRRLSKMQDRTDAMADDIEELLTEVGDELIVTRAVFAKKKGT